MSLVRRRPRLPTDIGIPAGATKSAQRKPGRPLPLLPPSPQGEPTGAYYCDQGERSDHSGDDQDGGAAGAFRVSGLAFWVRLGGSRVRGSRCRSRRARDGGRRARDGDRGAWSSAGLRSVRGLGGRRRRRGLGCRRWSRDGLRGRVGGLSNPGRKGEVKVRIPGQAGPGRTLFQSLAVCIGPKGCIRNARAGD